MKISIITPTHNAEKVVEDAILSVRAQCFTDFEHLIVDACSTDGTLDILRKYGHLRWISEPDQGIYDALNKGVEMAHGEWLYFLGADDRLHTTDVLTRVGAELLEPFKVIYGDVVSERFNGRYGGPYHYRDILKTNICQQSLFFHREVFHKTGKFNTRYPFLSDWDHNFRWLSDPDIPSRHVDMIIADYGAKGVSSVSRDDDFYADRRFNYLRYGQAILPKGLFLQLTGREILKSIKTGNLGRIPECFKMGLAVVRRRQRDEP